MLAPDRVEDAREVVEELVEALDVAARAFGAAVPALVVGVNDAASLREPERERLVAPAVLGVAVNEQQRARGVLGLPAAPEQAEAVGGAEMRLDPAQRRSLLARQDAISRFIRSRAARTRLRYVTPRMSEPQK